MPTTPRGRSALVLLLALLPLTWAAPASAHSALIGSTPESGSVVRALPASIELRFNETLSDISPAIVVRSGGETVATPTPEVDGQVLRAPAPQDLPDGEYTVVWRVVSADGHPVDGVVPFTLSGTGREAAPSAPTERTPPPAENTAAAIALAVAAPVALFVALAVVLLRRRRPTSPTRKDTP